VALTLIDFLKGSKDPIAGGVIQGLLMRSRAMQIVPWVDINTLQLTVTRWATLPTTGFRKLNAAFAESAGTKEQLQETVYSFGGDTDVDLAFTRDKNALTDPRAEQIDMRIASMTYTFNDYFINGDQASDPDGFTGLKKRIANLPAAQSIVAAVNGLDVKASTANQNTFVDLLDQAIYALDNGDFGAGTATEDGGSIAAFMNDSSLLGFSSTLRRLGLLDQTRDMFGRTIDAYKGIPFYDIGVKSDQTTRIIPNTETTGSSSLTTSIYFVKLGQDGEFFHGIQMFPLDVRDLGELQSGPQFRTRFEWILGLAHFNKRAMSRLSGVIWS
jgi:hypothetical protein